MINQEIVLEMVGKVRHKQPRIGGRKLYYLLEKDIKAQGIDIGRDRLIDILRDNDLLIKPKRSKKVTTTDSAHALLTYENHLSEQKADYANQVWVADMTYVKIKGGFAYLFLITDLYSRKIVGYHLSKDMKAIQAVEALNKALSLTQGKGPDIHHSDRGVQYCSRAYVEILREKQSLISMSQKGNPYHNAVAERVNGILKTEWIYPKNFKKLDFNTAQQEIKEIINTYNNERPHSSLGNRTPQEVYEGRDKEEQAENNKKQDKKQNKSKDQAQEEQQKSKANLDQRIDLQSSINKDDALQRNKQSDHKISNCSIYEDYTNSAQ